MRKLVLTLALIVEGANKFVESIFGTEVMTEERNRLYELSATFADDFNGLSTRLEVGSCRVRALFDLGTPFGLIPSFPKCGLLHIKARGKVFGNSPSPDLRLGKDEVI